MPNKENTVRRVKLEDMEKEAHVRAIRDCALRDRLLECVAGKTGTSFKQEVAAFSEKTGVRSARSLKTNTVVLIRDKQGAPYKGYESGGNAFVEIYRDVKGRWRAEVVSLFEANQPGFQQEGYRTRRQLQGFPLVMRLFKNDCIAVGAGEERQVFRLVKLSRNQLCFAPHYEGGDLQKRGAAKDDYFKYTFKAPSTLQKEHARKVSVDIMGRLADPGPGK